MAIIVENIDRFWISAEPVEPVELVELDDLVERHEAAAIELRTEPDLLGFWDEVIESSLGFSGIKDAHVGRHIVLELDAKDADDAGTLTRTMCQKLLANPVTEDFEIASVKAA